MKRSKRILALFLSMVLLLGMAANVSIGGIQHVFRCENVRLVL